MRAILFKIKKAEQIVVIVFHYHLLKSYRSFFICTTFEVKQLDPMWAQDALFAVCG